MKEPTEWNPSPPDPAIFANAIAQLWRARITENELWCPEEHYRQVQHWLDDPAYDLDPINCVFSPKAKPTVVGGSNFSSVSPINTLVAEHNKIDITTRPLAERRQQVVTIIKGCTIKLEWYEFVDREAKSLYWSEVLRRRAWQAHQKGE